MARNHTRPVARRALFALALVILPDGALTNLAARDANASLPPQAFVLSQSGHAATLVVSDSDWPGFRRAATDLPESYHRSWRVTRSTTQRATDTLAVAKLFTNGVVLQRNAPIPVWGSGSPRERVVVRFKGNSTSTIVDSAGRWSVAFPASAAGGPFEISVDGSGQHLHVADVMIGDVWVASGQSNMEFPLSLATDAPRVIAAAHDSLIREFKVPASWSEQPSDDLAGGSWAPADPRHVAAFSAVGYFFARELRAAEHVPIGIVNATWGGSAIETWLSADAQGLDAAGPARSVASERARLDSLRDAFRGRFGDLTKDSGLVNGSSPWASPTLDDARWARISVPALWESKGYDALDGVAWYRTTVRLTEEEAARGATLSLGPIDDDDITWVNGVEVGRTQGYNVPRQYEVRAAALHPGENVIAVRVVDYGGGGGIYGTPDQITLKTGSATYRLAGDWKFRVAEIHLETDGQRLNKLPAITYNKMVHPLLAMPIKGVIWYQGESNANNEAQARAYRGQFQQLITSWRRAWRHGRNGDFPFLWVQLPNYGAIDPVPLSSGGAWAVQRAAMAEALTLAHTGQAITIDVGEANDIHPKDKLDVGHRLAVVARRVAYGEDVRSSGPTYRDFTLRKGRVVVRFANVDGGLLSHASDGRVGAFAVAGVDRHFVWASARVEGDHVLVWSDRVPNPVAVRYAWANNPADANLYNRAGLPAVPFRSDRW